MRKIFSAAILIALCAALLDITLDVPLNAKRSLNLGVFDILIWLGLASVILFRSLRNETPLPEYIRRCVTMCWPGLLFVAVAIISAGHATVTGSSETSKVLIGKTIFQYAEYLVVAPIVFLAVFELFKSFTSFVKLIDVFFVVPFVAFFGIAPEYPATVNLCLFGLLFTGNIDLFTGKHHQDKEGKENNIYLSIYLTSIVVVVTSIWLMVCFAFSAVFTSRLRKSKGWIYVLFILLFSILVNYYSRPASYKDFFNGMQTYKEYKPEGAMFATTVPAMRYYRWYANLNMLSANPVFGVGPGVYNKALKNYYGTLDVPEGRTDLPELHDLQSHEPYTFSAYGVVGAEMGLPGLLALLVLLVELMVRGCKRGDNFAPAIAGAGLLLIMVCLWTNPLVRMTGPLIGFLYAASMYHVTDRGKADETGCKSENSI